MKYENLFAGLLETQGSHFDTHRSKSRQYATRPWERALSAAGSAFSDDQDIVLSLVNQKKLNLWQARQKFMEALYSVLIAACLLAGFTHIA